MCTIPGVSALPARCAAAKASPAKTKGRSGAGARPGAGSRRRRSVCTPRTALAATPAGLERTSIPSPIAAKRARPCSSATKERVSANIASGHSVPLAPAAAIVPEETSSSAGMTPAILSRSKRVERNTVARAHMTPISWTARSTSMASDLRSAASQTSSGEG